MSEYYRRDGTLYPEGMEGLLQWARDYEDFLKRHVKKDRVGRFFISTVWLGLDHSFCFHSNSDCGCRPLIFETMVFDRRHARLVTFCGVKRRSPKIMFHDRYSSLDDAIAGHAEAIKKFKRKKMTRAQHKKFERMMKAAWK